MSHPDREHPVAELSAYLDGELDDAARASVAAHLAQCAACRDLLDDLRALAHASRSELAPAPPDGIESRVRAALDRESATDGFVSRFARHVPIAAAASVLLLVAVAILVRGDLAGRFAPEHAPAAADATGEPSEIVSADQPYGEAKRRTPRDAGRDAGPAGVGGPGVPAPEAVAEPRPALERSRDASGALASKAGPSPEAAARDAEARVLGDEAARVGPDTGAAERQAGTKESFRQDVPVAEEELAASADTPATGERARTESAAKIAPRADDAAAEGAEVAPVAPGNLAGRREAAADRTTEADRAGVPGKQVAGEPGTAAEIAQDDALRAACTDPAPLLGQHAMTVRAESEGALRALVAAAEGTALGVTAARVDDASGPAVVFLVPVRSWPAFRAWALGRDDVQAALPPTADDREPAGAACVRIRAGIERPREGE